MSEMVVVTSSKTNGHGGNEFPHAENEQTALKQLLTVSTTILAQGVDLVENALTSDDQLTVHSQYLPGSTIGKHLRHARDHFVILMDCISSEAPFILNYDVRSRNTPMETNLKAAREALLQSITQLEDIVPSIHLDEPMTLNAITPFPQVLQTTFARELWFAALHAIHHWSMVRVIAGELNIKLEDSFGFAPSTLVHRGNEAALAKAKF